MTSVYRIAVILMISMFFFSCNQKGELQVVSQNFEDEVELQQNLVFQFNKDLIPDSLLGSWDTTDFMQLVPAVRGKFKWNAANELVFSPAEGFAPGTTYEAKLTNSIVAHSKKKYSFDSKAIMFHTAPLRITNSHILWTRGKGQANVMVQLDLTFNYDVSLEKVASHLKLSHNGSNVALQAASTGVGKVLSVQFMPLNELDQETDIKVLLSKGVQVVPGTYASKADTSYTAFIPSRYTLAISTVTAVHNGTQGILTVNTSQPVVETSLKSSVSIAPDVPFELVVSDEGFTLTSAQFNPSVVYQVTVTPQLEGQFGGRMKEAFTTNVSFGKLAPSITFAQQNGYYLSSAGYKNVALNIVNVPKLQLYVIKVYENNIEQLMRRGKEYDYHYDDESGSGSDYRYYQTEEYGDTVYKRTYDVSKLPKVNAAHILHLDFQDKLKGFTGMYIIGVKSAEHEWVQDSKLLNFSDVGLIVKQEKNALYVFANSIATAQSLSGVPISFISTNNQKVATIPTNGDGVAIFKDIDKQAPGFKIGMVTAKKGDEFTCLLLSNTQIGTARFDVGGRVMNDARMNAFIYPERNLYRPGETVHIATMVRNEKGVIIPDMPVKMQLTMPNGKAFSVQRKTLNAEGGAEFAYSLPVSVPTGTYTAILYSGNDVMLNSYDISIEDFMPDRIKAKVEVDRKELQPRERIVASIKADNLFGTPAANRDYECQMNLDKIVFSPTNYKDYKFDIEGSYYFNTIFSKGKTSEQGLATVAFEADSVRNVGILRGSVMASVFDETGRPVHRYASFEVLTQSSFLGLKSSEDYVGTGVPYKMQLIALNKQYAPVSATARIEVIRKEWHSVIQQSGNSYRYVSQSEEKIQHTQTISISGTQTNFSYTPTLSGDYEVRLYLPGATNYVSKQFYAWGYGATDYTSFEVNNEGNVDITTDKTSYTLGEPIKLLFTTPFDGRMLVTLERDNVLKYYYLDAKNKSASLTLNATDEHIPNVYVAATLVRPMKGDNMPLTVAHGYKSVTVENKAYKLPVAIQVSEQSRSSKAQKIVVHTQPGAMVTIAAVDEGILQVKNFVTPDPYNYFYQKVALGVNSYDIYPWLLPEIRTTVSSTGGDAAFGNGRVNPIFANRVKLVSYWSGIQQADAQGNVAFNVDLPQFSGDLRVMAVACKGKSFSQAEKHMKVADPIVISSALPRFLSPKDETIMGVSLSNTLGKATSATVKVTVSGPLGIGGNSTQTVNIAANREERVEFRIAAQSSIGVGKVVVSVQAHGETFVSTTEMGVRPPASLQKITQMGYAEAGKNTNIDITNNFLPATVQGKMVFGKSPLVQFTKNINDLVQYPYGCVEQTVSAAFPQIYYSELVKTMYGVDNRDCNPTYNVQQAIAKLQSMQQNNGALSYWPDGYYESWFGSVYATHFLLEAQKAGYTVNQQTIDRLLTYLKFKLSKKETLSFFYNKTPMKMLAPMEVPYSLYVLSMAGQAQPATMNYYKAHKELLNMGGRYMLYGAFSLAGMPLQAKDVLPATYQYEDQVKELGGSFSSPIRDEALSLYMLLDVDAFNPQIGGLTQHLISELKRERYLSTQENVFSILALGKVAKKVNQTNATASLIVNGSPVAKSTGADVTVAAKQFLGKSAALQVAGKGGYYYSYEVSGITADGSYKQEDSRMRIRRTFMNREGKTISGLNFKQNDLVIVHIQLEAATNSAIDNVAVTDMLPAGFEIENTRLNELPNLSWITNQETPEFMDIRDDRINFFTSATPKAKHFYYMVRVVTPGDFQLGPVMADAMYDGAYHSYHGAGVVHVAYK